MGKPYISPVSGRTLSASAFPGFYSGRYELFLELPEFKYPEIYCQTVSASRKFSHEFFMIPDWLGLRSVRY